MGLILYALVVGQSSFINLSTRNRYASLGLQITVYSQPEEPEDPEEPEETDPAPQFGFGSGERSSLAFPPEPRSTGTITAELFDECDVM